MKKYEQKIIVKKNQLSKLFVTQFVVVVATLMKRKRKQFKKIKWKKTFTDRDLLHKLSHEYNYYYVCS